MTLEILSFILGALLLLIGIIGGGFEIKELKLPKVMGTTRFISIIVGSLFITLGIIGRDNITDFIKSPETVEVPNVVNLPLEMAQTKLSMSGLNVGNVDSVQSKIAIIGTVLKQTPQAGDKASKGDEVNLVVAEEEPDIVNKARENWIWGNYDVALDNFALIVQKSDKPKEKRLAEKRLNWLQPYRGRIIFADDFEINTSIENMWEIHPGYPQTEGSIFKRVQIDSNSVLEGYNHYHAVAQRVLACFKKDDIIANFEIHLKFYPVNPLECAAHINTTLDPQEGRFTIGLYMAEKRLEVFEERYGKPIEKGRTQVFNSRWYNLRVTAQGRNVRIFLDDKLMLNYESLSSQPLLKNFNLETLTGIVRFDDVLVITQ